MWVEERVVLRADRRAAQSGSNLADSTAVQ